MSGLFSIFNTSKRGLFTTQKSIGITSHNISNANTEGYSRQRAVVETTTPFEMPSFYSSVGAGQTGTGCEVKVIQRVRDEFLDFQLRNENSTLGQYESREKYLSEIENIFNEPSDTGISTLVGKVFDSWQQLSKQPQTSNARTVVAQQSLALTNELNHTYAQLQKLKDNVQSEIKQSIFQTNGILDKIKQLNLQIKEIKVSGQEPNDLMDRRDLLLDKLSKSLNIKQNKKDFYALNVYPENIDGVPLGGEKLLVRNEVKDSVSRFSYITKVDKKVTEKDISGNPTKYEVRLPYLKSGNSNNPGKEITIENISADDIDEVYRYIDECRTLWADEDGEAYLDDETIDFKEIVAGGTFDKEAELKLNKKLGLFVPERGELAGYMTVQQDADKYIDRINRLAKAVAFSVNAVHSGVYDDYSKKSGSISAPAKGILKDKTDFMPLFVNNDKAKYDANGEITNLGDILAGEVEITAGNITINKEIVKDVMKIKTRTNDNDYAHAEDNIKDGETDGNRALAIAQLRDKLFSIQNIGSKTDRKTFIENLTGDGISGILVDDGLGVKTIKSNINGMKLDSYFRDVVDELGVQTQQAHRVKKNKSDMIKSFNEMKASNSGVSLDEEMANMIQFQHAYQANAKVIATVDELLDVVINGLKR